MIADNKIYGLGVDNLETFNSFLEELNFDLDIPGFDENILQSMVADAVDVSDIVMEYGSIDDSEIQNIKDAKARKEAMIERAEQAQQAATSVPAVPVAPKPIESEQEFIDSGEADTKSDEIRKSVICPNCGEKIWL